ncbi:hypothetical protein [Reyranella sp.]
MTDGPTTRWRPVLLWGLASLVAAATVLSFVLWGLNGPAYLVDLIAAYCL